MHRSFSCISFDVYLLLLLHPWQSLGNLFISQLRWWLLASFRHEKRSRSDWLSFLSSSNFQVWQLSESMCVCRPTERNMMMMMEEKPAKSEPRFRIFFALIDLNFLAVFRFLYIYTYSNRNKLSAEKTQGQTTKFNRVFAFWTAAVVTHSLHVVF